MGRRGATRKELRGEEGEMRAKAPDGTWTNPNQDEERPPKEEWPIAMKILTGTDHSNQSFCYRFFPFFPFFFPIFVLQHPSPTF